MSLLFRLPSSVVFKVVTECFYCSIDLLIHLTKAFCNSNEIYFFQKFLKLKAFRCLLAIHTAKDFQFVIMNNMKVQNLEVIKPDELILKYQHFPIIEKLINVSISTLETFEDCRLMSMFLNHCANLRSIKLSSCVSSLDFEHFICQINPVLLQKLTSIHFHNALSQEAMDYISVHCVALQHLSVFDGGFASFTEFSVMKMLQLSPNKLRSIKLNVLTHITAITFDTINTIMLCCVDLQYLFLVVKPDLVDIPITLINKLLQKCPILKDFTVFQWRDPAHVVKYDYVHKTEALVVVTDKKHESTVTAGDVQTFFDIMGTKGVSQLVVVNMGLFGLNILSNTHTFTVTLETCELGALHLSSSNDMILFLKRCPKLNHLIVRGCKYDDNNEVCFERFVQNVWLRAQDNRSVRLW